MSTKAFTLWALAIVRFFGAVTAANIADGMKAPPICNYGGGS